MSSLRGNQFEWKCLLADVVVIVVVLVIVLVMVVKVVLVMVMVAIIMAMLAACFIWQCWRAACPMGVA